MLIRPFEEKDAPGLVEIFYYSIEVLTARFYTLEQRAVWLTGVPSVEEVLIRCRDGRETWIAEEGGQPIGYIDLTPKSQIDHFYVHPDAAGRGVGQALYKALLEAAQKASHQQLSAEASEPARRFLLRSGWEEVERRDFELHGVLTYTYLMSGAVSAA